MEGTSSYTPNVPFPVPDTRSEINVPQFEALFTALRDTWVPDAQGNAALRIGSDAPADPAASGAQTVPTSQWFCYFRLYAPGAEAFDGSWKPSNFAQAEAPET